MSIGKDEKLQVKSYVDESQRAGARLAQAQLSKIIILWWSSGTDSSGDFNIEVA